MKKSNPSILNLQRILNASRYSADGLKAAWQHEGAFRQELVLCLILFPFAIYLAKTGLDFILLTSSLILLLIVELINSAIEAAIDRHGEAWHALSKRAKDLGSAAVLLAFINALLIWFGVLWF